MYERLYDAYRVACYKQANSLLQESVCLEIRTPGVFYPSKAIDAVPDLLPVLKQLIEGAAQVRVQT